MSATNEWFKWHLTLSKGWVQGNQKEDLNVIAEKPIPKDRVLTLRFCEKQSCLAAETRYTMDEVYRGDDKELIQSLTEKYGEIPDDNFARACFRNKD